MRDWPPIADPELLRRLALDDEEFAAMWAELVAAWPRREFDPVAFEQALGYPWARPQGSFILSGEKVQLLSELDPVRRESAIAAYTENRHPIVSFGANAAPSRLALKFAHFPDPDDRELLVLAGELHDLDVGVVPSVSLLGYVPASPFDSPGTAVSAAVVWVTPAQSEQLAWTELAYRLGRLEDAHFAVRDVALEIDQVFAFVARLGALEIDGEPVALAAVPAERRSAPALSQTELLDLVAGLVLGPEARAEDLVRALCDDLPAVMAQVSQTLWPCGRQLTSSWTPFPAEHAARF